MITETMDADEREELKILKLAATANELIRSAFAVVKPSPA